MVFGRAVRRLVRVVRFHGSARKCAIAAGRRSDSAVRQVLDGAFECPVLRWAKRVRHELQHSGADDQNKRGERESDQRRDLEFSDI